MTDRKMTGVALPSALIDRINKYLGSPVSIAKSKRELIEMSIKDFLSREEIINAKLEKEFLRVREKLR